MSLNLNDEQLRAAVAGAIIQTLTQEKREELISHAVQALLTPPPTRNSWDKPLPSPIQQAFDVAVENVAREVAKEQVRSDPALRARLAELITKAVERLMNSDEVLDRLAQAFGAAIAGDR